MKPITPLASKATHQHTQPKTRARDPNRHVVNLSDTELNLSSRTVLEKGLNFAIAPKKISIEDIICSIKESIKHLPENEAEEVRQNCARTLRRAKLPKPNITNEEYKALKELRKNDQIVILKADKGGATIILNKEDYVNKMKSHLDLSGCYKKLNKNPLSCITREVAETIKRPYIDDDIKKKLLTSDPLIPRIYGLPNIHKSGIPLRPLVDTIGSPSYRLPKFLANKLKPLVGNTRSFIKDSPFFIEKIKNRHFDENDLLLSLDVVSLFAMIRINDEIKFIENLADHETAELVGLCLRSTFFSFQGEIYEQTYGVSMGSPLSPIIAKIFMKSFEQKALSTAYSKPEWWSRYVDDTFLIWAHGKEELVKFVDHLNKKSDSIKFTTEMEESRCLPFLDTMIIKNQDGGVSHKVYRRRKKSHTEQYPHALSHHHPQQKMGFMNTLITGAIRISDTEHLEAEKQHLPDVFLSNGYDAHQIRRAFAKTKKPRHVKEKKVG